ncbi:hypothetical protein AMAG_00354 [Allomyces macrogynus ATCC 38327]|uniref:RING-type domain-containing protein n=1 Tax=Allomyces macrogynus (strain ATCC 38327) TaxID=578462 RepID=A0A0L0RV99_ALLM3|nr:hypothetical protein AMAG_00354 [Allomyces macrogynus ATCC 38327]|eukprot:KNE54377.1 hypothetical protein AMAG_00354 [Allomyces macrogynus ATCC 38327]
MPTTRLHAPADDHDAGAMTALDVPLLLPSAPDTEPPPPPAPSGLHSQPSLRLPVLRTTSPSIATSTPADRVSLRSATPTARSLRRDLSVTAPHARERLPTTHRAEYLLAPLSTAAGVGAPSETAPLTQPLQPETRPHAATGASLGPGQGPGRPPSVRTTTARSMRSTVLLTNPQARTARRNMTAILMETWTRQSRGSHILLTLLTAINLAQALLPVGILAQSGPRAVNECPQLVAINVAVCVRSFLLVVLLPYLFVASRAAPDDARHIPYLGACKQLDEFLRWTTAILFILANFWVFMAPRCDQAPVLVAGTIAWILLTYLIYLFPLVLCLFLVFCLPCLLVVANRSGAQGLQRFNPLFQARRGAAGAGIGRAAAAAMAAASGNSRVPRELAESDWALLDLCTFVPEGAVAAAAADVPVAAAHDSHDSACCRLIVVPDEEGYRDAEADEAAFVEVLEERRAQSAPAAVMGGSRAPSLSPDVVAPTGEPDQSVARGNDAAVLPVADMDAPDTPTLPSIAHLLLDVHDHGAPQDPLTEPIRPSSLHPRAATPGTDPVPAAVPAPVTVLIPEGTRPLTLPDEDALCVICFEDYRQGDLICLLKCQHHYHVTPCLRQWFTLSTLCPICKRDVEEMLHPPA